MTIRPELIDELLKDCSDPREVLAEGGLLKQLTKAIIERCLETELDAHLGYPKHGRREESTANARNGAAQEAQRNTGRNRDCRPARSAGQLFSRNSSRSIRPA